jgi:hypothetical protein
MQDLNEDLDDQFREAVDRYSLRPVDSRWNELSHKIISFKRPSSMSDTIRSKYKKWFLLLIFILFLPITIIFLIPGFNARSRTNGQSNAAAVKKNYTPVSVQKTNDEQRINPQQKTKGEQTGNTVQKTNAAQKLYIDQGSFSDIAQPHLSLPESADQINGVQGKSKISVQENKMTGSNTAGRINSSISEPAIKYSPAVGIHPVGLAMAPMYTDIQKNLPLQHLDRPRRQGFYLALMGGPVLTEVAQQGLKKSGYDFGLLAGYTLNKRFSLETGLIYIKQYYFVSGKYYNEITGVNNASSLEGHRNAFEIPLTLKYNMIRAASGNFFVSAGASTFVGVKDKVLIQVSDGVIPPSLNFNYGVTSYMPSYLNMSLGYEYKIGKFANLRIEPYVQIPLNSNTGNSFKTQVSGRSIQVFNTGIHIGISRFIR